MIIIILFWDNTHNILLEKFRQSLTRTSLVTVCLDKCLSCRVVQLALALNLISITII